MLTSRPQDARQRRRRRSVFTVREAIRAGKPAVVPAGGGTELPRFAGGQWVACAIGPVVAHRWVPTMASLTGPSGG